MTDAASLADRVREGDLRLHELEAHADADTAAEARRLLVESQSGASLDAVGNYGFPAEAAESAIENMVGSIQVPMGVAGPVSVDGGSVAGEKYLPSRPPRARSSRRSTAVARSSTAPAADRPRPQVRDDPRAGVPRRRRCRGRGARLVDPRQLRGAEGGRGGDDEPRRTPRRDAVRRRQLGVPAIPLRHQGRDGDEHGHHRHRGRLRRRRSRDGRLARSSPSRATSVPTKSPPPSTPSRGAAGASPPTFESRARSSKNACTPRPKRSRNSTHARTWSAPRRPRASGSTPTSPTSSPRCSSPPGRTRRRSSRARTPSRPPRCRTATSTSRSPSPPSKSAPSAAARNSRRSPGASISSASAAAATRRLQRRRPRQMHRRRFPRGRTLPSLRARLAAPLQRPRRTRSVTAWGLLSDRDS